MRVFVDLYSGRLGPHWTLTKEETAKVEAELARIPEHEAAQPPRLGFRGLVLERDDDPRSRRRIAAPGRPPHPGELTLARRLLETAGDRVPDSVRQLVLTKLDALEEI